MLYFSKESKCIQHLRYSHIGEKKGIKSYASSTMNFTVCLTKEFTTHKILEKKKMSNHKL